MRLVTDVETLAVGIDALPGSDRNLINTGREGVLPAGVLVSAKGFTGRATPEPQREAAMR